MSAQKNAIVTGSIFFALRLVFCVLFAVMFLTTGSNFEFSPPIVFAITFGIGAFTDLFLILGASKKNVGAVTFGVLPKLLSVEYFVALQSRLLQ